MKFRLIKDSEEIIVITEDGGVATIRDVEGYVDGDFGGKDRKSTTDYYQGRLNSKMIDEDNIWESLGEGKMYWNDWKTPFDNPEHVEDALNWLCVGEVFVADENIWPNFKG